MRGEWGAVRADNVRDGRVRLRLLVLLPQQIAGAVRAARGPLPRLPHPLLLLLRVLLSRPNVPRAHPPWLRHEHRYEQSLLHVYSLRFVDPELINWLISLMDLRLASEHGKAGASGDDIATTDSIHDPLIKADS